MARSLRGASSRQEPKLGHGFGPRPPPDGTELRTGMDGLGVSVLVPLELLSSPGAGGCAYPSRCLGATKPGPAESAGVCSKAAGDRSVEGSDRRGPGAKMEASQETEAKDVT